MSNVEHPKHYNFSKIEVIDVIDCYFRDFYYGNIFKYISRAKLKNGLEDLNKSKFYLERLKSRSENIEDYSYKDVKFNFGLLTDFLDTDYFSNIHKELIRKLQSLSYYQVSRGKFNIVLYQEYIELFNLLVKELENKE
jgi:hypothetical protein